MYTTILIIVLGFSTSQSGATTIQVPFQKMEQCLAAKTDIEKQRAAYATKWGNPPIISSGCSDQGRVR